MKYVSRADWGARAYKQPSGAIQYSRPRKGVKVHYLGGPYSSRPHSQCSAYVRQIQAQHMNVNGWSDIGYSFVVCEHGYVYEGRGLKRRNSANGNTDLNEQHYAVLGLHGTDSGQPGPELLNGLRDAIDYCRVNGPCGSEIKGHKDGYATACPGDELYAWVKAGAPRPTKEEPMTKDEMEQLAALTARKVALYKDERLDSRDARQMWDDAASTKGQLTVIRQELAELKAKVAAGGVDVQALVDEIVRRLAN